MTAQPRNLIPPAGDAGPRRILLANHWHDDNRGDSAITQGIVGLLHQHLPDTSIDVITLAESGSLFDGCARHLASSSQRLTVSPSPAPTELRGRRVARGRVRVLADAALLSIRMAPALLCVLLGVPVRQWRRLVDDHDLVVLVGGSNIFDDRAVPMVLSLPRLVAVLAPAYNAIRQQRRVVLLGHTLGPFARRTGRWLAGRMLRGADLAVVREARSIEVAESLGIRRVEEAPDMAFALDARMTPRVRRLLASLPSAPGRTLAISVRQHPTMGADADRRLIATFEEAARWLVAHGIVDGIAVVAHTVGPTPIEDDRPISARLAAALSDLPSVLIDDNFGADELSAFYGATAAVVAVRLHAAILALNAGTPTFAVAYLTAKTHGVMSQVGLPDAVAEFATVSAEDITAGVSTLLRDGGLRARLLVSAEERKAVLSQAAGRWLTEPSVAKPAAVRR